ncbi:helix-turn-helix domain-containing protein [Seongchinamella sediminis]|nr:helix-turn-helix domain-containing protein [Seongchinamella sediminis]
MTSDVALQADAFVTPGMRLRRARLESGMSEREVEERLNLVPGYVVILERDDYQSLRSPAFARGYVRAYGQLMQLDEQVLLAAFDEQRQNWEQEKQRVETRALQLQSSGLSVVIGLAILSLLVFMLWWWFGREDEPAAEPLSQQANEFVVAGAEIPAGEQ